MKIKKMTATFGCLDGESLSFSDGINLFVLPNEGGKSTWAAFLTAMFYGLDSRRAAKGRLTDKERYTPWSGKPMEGVVELTMEGRTIVLQRTSSHGKPLGELKAWDKHTGLQIPSLTAENCGKTLLGVEREVFRRSAFLSGSELAVTPDHDLSRRLGSLAASGRQTDSFLQADDRLRTWQNRLRYHQSGLIPQAKRQLEALTDAAEVQPPQTAHLPSEDRLLHLLGSLQMLCQSDMPCPEALKGVGQEEIISKAQKDLAGHRALTAGSLAAVLLFAIAGAALSPWCLIACVPPLIVFLWNIFGSRLPRAYGVTKTAEVMAAALRWRDSEKLRWQRDLILEEIRDFAPEADTPERASAAVEQALNLHRRAAAFRAPDRGEEDRLRRTIEELERKEQAIIRARQALRLANEQLQQTYVPKLTGLGGEYLKKLTLGRYDGLVMNEKMELSVRETGGLLRPLPAVSSGTQDQTWLALRLAMTRLLLPAGAPVVLDDALLTFDKDRESVALEVLKQEDRQVIVFSCR